MGHYGVVTAYDDATEIFLIQDSYVKADYAYSYARVEKYWQAFNYVYLVVYPSDQESKVLSILGPYADETYSLQQAAQRALEETTTMTGKQQFFAWYNYGTSLVNLTDYFGAAQAYDNAYAFLMRSMMAIIQCGGSPGIRPARIMHITGRGVMRTLSAWQT